MTVLCLAVHGCVVHITVREPFILLSVALFLLFCYTSTTGDVVVAVAAAIAVDVAVIVVVPFFRARIHSAAPSHFIMRPYGFPITALLREWLSLARLNGILSYRFSR